MTDKYLVSKHVGQVKEDNGGYELASDLLSARRVLKIEAAALTTLSSTLGGDFISAINLLIELNGRVIVSGIGKSGHIARKVASTLASTGTPAFFVHPTEASHGDLGMIIQGDGVIIFSNSGETGELSDLITYTRHFAISLVVITGCQGSSLAMAADVALVLPTTTEACPLGLSPTTSTTMMLALGDAIAVTLLARRKFSASDFHRFHPGGHLGRKLLRVADLMHQGNSIPLVPAHLPMAEVILAITQKSLGCAGVVDMHGTLLGVITDGDLRRHMSPSLFEQTAETVMTINPKLAHANMLAVEALRFMHDNKITSLFVLSERKQPIGLIHIHDCLHARIE